MMPREYVERVLRAQVYALARETPLEVASRLSTRLGNRVLLKREDLQPVFSFKLRGAYNKLASLREDERARCDRRFCWQSRTRARARCHPTRRARADRDARDYAGHQS